MKKVITTTAVVLAFAAVTAGCGNSGGRSGKPVYGPGSTGHLGGATGGTGSTGGGATPGGGSTGSFSAAPALNAPRAQHTATTLPDGRVLVTGGTDGNSIYFGSEVFDPVANAWTPVQSTMNVNGFNSARQLHTATLMSNGRVLIAGGLGADAPNQFSALSSCFVFDPASDTFTQTGSMPQGRGWHHAVALPNGHVLVAAGLNDQMATIKSSATYDPASGQWQAAGSSGAHTHGALVTVGQQTILAGGTDITYTNNGPQLNALAAPVTERFDAQARTFGQAPNNVGDRIFYSGEASSAGKALFAGGLGIQGQNLVPTDTTEVYDPSQNTFAPGTPMSVARYGAEIAEIGTSGDMLIVGGVAGQANTAVCEIFQMSSYTVVGQANMAEARVDHKAVTLKDGRIMVIGGVDDYGNALDSCEFFTR